MTLALALSALFLSACSTGVVPEQLDAFRADLSDGNYDELVTSGELSVRGEGSDFTLAIDGQAIRVHSPGLSDLMTLDGQELQVSLSWAGLHGERSAWVADDHGPVYIADAGWGIPEVDVAFGEGFASWGQTVATARDDQYDWSWTQVDFRTDAGVVSLLPGEVASFRVNGDLYRVVVLAAYQVDARPMAALPCGGISDMLSYEMMRVTSEPEPQVIVRDPSSEFAYLGCL